MSGLRAVISRVCRVEALLSLVELMEKLILVWPRIPHMEFSMGVNSSFERGSYKVGASGCHRSHYPAKTGVTSYLDQISSTPNSHSCAPEAIGYSSSAPKRDISASRVRRWEDHKPIELHASKRTPPSEEVSRHETVKCFEQIFEDACWNS